ncbi:hypothetical protein DMI65_17135 [Escherichia coli]|nr:hypothetical protein [Escherichia coli]
MDVTNDDYIHLLSALLPPRSGMVSQRSGDCRCGTVINPRSSACGCPDAGADPRTTTELINRWERLCGLRRMNVFLRERRPFASQQRLDAKVNLAGGINEDFTLHSLLPRRPDATITRYDKHFHLLICLY